MEPNQQNILIKITRILVTKFINTALIELVLRAKDRF
jgi:hypothetical protein